MSAPTDAIARADYERSVAARPLYHDGTPRKTWEQLDHIAQGSWRKAPAP